MFLGREKNKFLAPLATNYSTTTMRTGLPADVFQQEKGTKVKAKPIRMQVKKRESAQHKKVKVTLESMRQSKDCTGHHYR